jgi:uncharacterized protein (DUF3084 family)
MLCHFASSNTNNWLQAWQKRLQTMEEDLKQREASVADASRDADIRCAAAAAAEAQLKTLQQEHASVMAQRQEDVQSAERALQQRLEKVNEREARSARLERDLSELQEQVRHSCCFISMHVVCFVPTAGACLGVGSSPGELGIS